MAQPPQQVKGYELYEELGKGGFGMVYRAHQPLIGREVAIKVILPLYANQPSFIRSFESEAQLIARLEHPHIVPLFDYWRDNEGAYLVMRYLRGGSLRERIQQHRLQPDQTSRIVLQMASALALAHRNGIVHRDVKPHNVMMDAEGNAYLTDFGIARPTANVDADEEGMFAGSPAYAAPEVLAEGLASPQSDMYALGIMVYEMLAGKHPFDSPTFTSLLSAQFNDPLPLLPMELELPASVNDVLQKATAKNPAERYGDILALALALQTVLLGDTVYITDIDTGHLRNPYKGLAAFIEADANDFFGREELVATLLERLRPTPPQDQTPPANTHFLAVVGPSASGKSSVVQAGLLPAIRDGALPGSDGWFIVQIEPDDRPVANIHDALLSIASHPPADLETRLRTDADSLNAVVSEILGRDSHLLIVIDNFEETFTLTQDEDERLHYMRLLTNAVTAPQSRVHVIVVLRADYYDRPLYDDALGTLMQQRTQLVLPMTREELLRAVTSPAETAGLQVDRDLLEIILADVAEEPGALPLLQYALSETFNYREGRRLTAAGYRATGGINGALSRRAEEAFCSLAADPHADAGLSEQDIARQMFLRLVSLSDNGYRRRRADRRELLAMGDAAAVNHVLDAFSAVRLILFEGKRSTREPQVELAHEALIRVWPRLQSWLEESREDLRVQAGLRAAAEAWLDSQRDPSYLLAGGRLAQVESWAASTYMPLNFTEESFVTASITHRDAAATAETARQQRELTLAQASAAASRRAANRLWLLVGVMLLAILCVAGLFGLARTAQTAAEAASIAADRSATQARSLQQAANAQVQLSYGRTDVALALALAAADTDPDSGTASAVLVETAYTRSNRHIYRDHASEVMGVAVSADGTLFASAGGRYNPTQRDDTDTDVRLWDIASQTVIHRLSGHTDTVWAVAFSPDGTLLASASADQTIRLWDVASGTLLRTLTGHTATVRTLAFTPDGTQLVSGSGEFSAGLRPSDDFSVRLWNVADGSQQCIFQPANQLKSEVRTVAVSPDGSTVLSGSGAERTPDGDNVIVMWDVATCRERTRLYGHTNLINALAFSPDGTRFVSASADNNVILWNLASRTPIRYFVGHTDWVNAVTFDPSGQFILSGGWDNTIILWDIASGRIKFQYVGHGAPIQSLVFHSSDYTFFSAAQDGTVRQWELENPLFLRRYGRTAADIATLTQYSPDGSRLLAATTSGVINIYDTATGQRLGAFRGHSNELYTLAFSHDGKRVLSGGSDGQLLLWDIDTRAIVMPFIGHRGGIWRAVFSPDESRILSGSDDSTVRVWDTLTGQQIHLFDTNLSEVYTVAYAPDGQTFYAGTLNREIVVWDANRFTERARSKGHASAPYASAVSPDGRWLVTGGYDNRVLLWDASTGAFVRQFYGHSKTVVAVDFSADSQTLITASLDRTVRFWEVASGEEVGRIDYGVALVSIDLSPDGQSVAVAADDEPLTRYQLPLLTIPALKTWVQTNRAVHTFTCEEADLYGVAAPTCTDLTTTDAS